MRIVVIGGVVSTELLLKKLIEHGFKEVLVFGFEPDSTVNVSGWVGLRTIANSGGFDYIGFKRVVECESKIGAFSPDVLFAVGLSQIIPDSILSISRLANIGFHPTMLPKGRGRAALAWLIIEGANGAATFFEMGSDVDDGAIYVQEPYDVVEGDDAANIEFKLLRAEAAALDCWLPQLKRGNLSATPQDIEQATWYGKRTPDDGCVDWSEESENICRLIKASAPPHPGAFTFSDNCQITLLTAEISKRREKGVIGRILKVYSDGAFEVQAENGLVKVTKWLCSQDWSPKVGMLLGYYEQLEIYRLKLELFNMKERLERIEKHIGLCDEK